MTNTFFFRMGSAFDMSDDTRERLWKNNQIGVCYGNFGLDPIEYPKKDHRSVIHFLKDDLDVSGGYVGADFSTSSDPRMLIGKVRTGTLQLQDGTNRKGERIELKTLTLHGVKSVLGDNPEYSLLQASRPRACSH